MKDQIDRKSKDGQVVKAKETTSARAAEPSKGPSAEANALKDLTSAGVASLLQTEFAGDDQDPEAGATKTETETEANLGEEVLPGKAKSDRAKGGENNKADAAAAGTEEVSSDEGETKADPEGETGDTEDAPAEETETTETTEDTDADPDSKSDEAAALPAELQTAIEQWEEAGGGELPPVLQTLVERRIGKLTGQRETERTARETAENRVKDLEAEVEGLKADPNRPAVRVTTVDMNERQLNQLETQAERLIGDAEAYLDESATEAERGRVEKFMAENGIADGNGLKRQVRAINGWLTRTLPGQRRAVQEFRAGEAKVAPVAKQLFPWLDDKASPEYQQAQKALELFPDLPSRTPEWKLALGVYVLGMKAMTALVGKPGAAANGTGNGKASASTPAAAVKKAPPKSPAGGSTAVSTKRIPGRQQAEENTRRQFETAPTRANVTELLKASLR